MFKPEPSHNQYLDVYKELYEYFGRFKADELYRFAQYHAYRNNMDFYEALNTHTDVIEYCYVVAVFNNFEVYKIGLPWQIKARAKVVGE